MAKTQNQSKSLSDLKESDNKAVILSKAGDLKVGVWPLEKQLGPKDCLLESKSNGICGTDLHLWKTGKVAQFELTKPLVLGHEPSAQVIAVGSEVKELKVGDKVAVDPLIHCGNCDFCRESRFNLCPSSFQHSRGLPPMSGCIVKYYTHPSHCCFKFPEKMSWDEGAMVEPFAVVVHACKRVNISPGHHVLVCGAGPVGLMAMLCAKAFGAAKVCITDLDQSKLDLAKKMGADQVFQIDPKTFNEKEFAKKLEKDFGHSPERCIECTGVESSLSMAIYAMKSGGKICALGLGKEKVNIPMALATMKEIEIIGSCRINDEYPLAIQLISEGKVDVKPLVTHRFHIDKAVEAFDLLKKAPLGVIKVIIYH